MKALVLVFLILVCYSNGDSVEDHYWRDFKGLIPNDAIPYISTDEPAYLGQFSVVAEYNSDIANIHTLVATISSGSQRAVAAYNGRTVYSNETSNFKILCSSNSRYRYSWNTRKVTYSPNCRYVVGGNEDNVPLFIGRTTKGKETVAGKIFSDASFHSGKLTVPYQGGQEEFDTYEILTYCY
ncbi:hypothetical protein FQR65_LT03892 [Abscondita terminalis]|nr:hypothetical protein FQR65_LT17481 [Abscondita terminalis]KAF5277186.1 hypothetical protein FQR65_LT03892 [Abscondita terminalis]